MGTRQGVNEMNKHVHKYYRVKLGKNKDYVVYRCESPGCTHYMPADLIVGCKSICHRCDKEFVITQNLMFKKPHCEDCIRHKSPVTRLILQELDTLLEKTR